MLTLVNFLHNKVLEVYTCSGFSVSVGKTTLFITTSLPFACQVNFGVT